MTYDQARGYCFEKNMWLADPMSPFLLDGIRDAMEEKNFSTVWFQPEWTNPDECWIEENIAEIGADPVFVERAVDCWLEFQAVCKKGQIQPEIQTCLDFQLAPVESKSYYQAEEYCESISPRSAIPIGNLPFFISQDELNLFKTQANITVYREQLLGLVRDPDVTSGWGALNGDQFIEVEVFAWAEGQPTSDEANICVSTKNADPLTWENVPCEFAGGINFSCRIQWEQFAGTECIAPALPDEICELGNCDPLIPTNFPFVDDSSTPSDDNIAVINSNLTASYIINGVGDKLSLNINAPNSDPEYTRYAQSAFIAGQLYLFGGLSDEKDPLDPRKIVKFDVGSCELILLPAKLTDDFTIGHAALATSDALICFPPSPGYNFCDVFDGTNSVTGYNSTYGHLYAGLGLYNGQPTTVGGSNEDGYRKVEALGPNGWTDLPDSPMNYYAPSLVGVANGDLYVLGGRDIDDNNSYQKSIYRLSKSTWTLMGSLTQPVGYGSAINVGSSIYIFAGENDELTYPIQRVDISDDNITTTLIGSQDEKYVFPILTTEDSNNCVVNSTSSLIQL